MPDVNFVLDPKRVGRSVKAVIYLGILAGVVTGLLQLRSNWFKSEQASLQYDRERDTDGRRIEGQMVELRNAVVEQRYERAEAIASDVLRQREVPEARIARCRLRCVTGKGNLDAAWSDAKVLERPGADAGFGEGDRMNRLMALADIERFQAKADFRGWDNKEGIVRLNRARSYYRQALAIRTNDPAAEQALTSVGKQIDDKASVLKELP